MTLRFSSIALLMTALALAAAGCARGRPVVNIPLQPTAKEQYAYAMSYKAAHPIDIITDPARIERTRDIIRQHYEKVHAEFPEDRTFTPLARLEVIEMNAGLDDQDARVSESDMEDALDELEALLEEYPEKDFVQAKALYDIALIYKRMGEFGEMQAAFREIEARFADNPNEHVRNIVARAKFFYDKTYIHE